VPLKCWSSVTIGRVPAQSGCKRPYGIQATGLARSPLSVFKSLMLIKRGHTKKCRPKRTRAYSWRTSKSYGFLLVRAAMFDAGSVSSDFWKGPPDPKPRSKAHIRSQTKNRTVAQGLKANAPFSRRSERGIANQARWNRLRSMLYELCVKLQYFLVLWLRSNAAIGRCAHYVNRRGASSQERLPHWTGEEVFQQRVLAQMRSQCS
jgi:hypothetical protein